MATGSAPERPPVGVRYPAAVVTRLMEVFLAGYGLYFAAAGGDDPHAEVRYLAVWNTVGAVYLIGGVLVVRTMRHDGASGQDRLPSRLWQVARGRRFSFLFTVAASLTGLAAAVDVVSDRSAGRLGTVVDGLGIIAVVIAWMLLHLGYARFYQNVHEEAGGGFVFPATPRPGVVDFLYFSFTVGVSFAVSDVEVQRRVLRWHLIVHAVVSFFYNAVVLAVGVGVLSNR